MDFSLLITIIGTVLTAIGTFVTIYYSFIVKDYKSEMMREIKRVNLIGVSELLRGAQNETRKLLYPNSPIYRGTKKEEVILNIQKSIDDTLTQINLDESDKFLRQRLIEAQRKLREYTQSNENKEKYISELHDILQECISVAKTNANNILGKEL